jgi:hypothetical protein
LEQIPSRVVLFPIGLRSYGLYASFTINEEGGVVAVVLRVTAW